MSSVLGMVQISLLTSPQTNIWSHKMDGIWISWLLSHWHNLLLCQPFLVLYGCLPKRADWAGSRMGHKEAKRPQNSVSEGYDAHRSYISIGRGSIKFNKISQKFTCKTSWENFGGQFLDISKHAGSDSDICYAQKNQDQGLDKLSSLIVLDCNL